MAVVSTVSGAPIWKCSQNEIVTPCACARCKTMRLATDPSTVRLPAKVDAMVMVSYNCCCSGSDVTKGLSVNTAGTLLTRLDRSTVLLASTVSRLSR